MFHKRSIFGIFSIMLVVIMMSSTASARPLEGGLSTVFTYQGKLSNSGSPTNGMYDFIFTLFDALTDGTQMDEPFPLKEVPVTDGLFTVQLEFKDVFDGTPLYLEIGVRPSGSKEDFNKLSPRQQLTAAPYAIYASKAPWSGLAEMPAGFSDGVDDNATYTAGDGLELTGNQFKGKGTPYQNVVIVAKSGGDYTTITAALNSITDASDTNRYLIYVAPGVYTDQVYMKEYVDIEGSGELTTTVTANAATLWGANNAELRFLTVECTGGDGNSYAIANSNASPHLTHVTARASGGTDTNYGIANYDYSSPTMMNVTASASGGERNYGVFSLTSSPNMINVTANASGGTGTNYGVANEDSSPTMMNVTASASGGNYSYGVLNYTSFPNMTNVTANASGGVIANTGVFNWSSSATISNSIISASGGTSSYGIHNQSAIDTIIVLVNNSQVSGITNTIRTDNGFITRVGNSQLNGGDISYNGGTVICFSVYDENYTNPGPNLNGCP
jgi:hypothetical protein